MPCRTLSHHAASTLQREQQRGPKSSVLPSATIASPDLALPDPTLPCLVYSPKRAAGKACALRAAVCNCNLAPPHQSTPHPARSHLVAPHLPSKESSRENRSSQCCRLQLLPDHVMPDHDIPSPAPPKLTMSTLRRKQQGTPKCSLLLSATIALPCLNPPYRTAPEHTTTGQAGPHWGLHQRMPSMIRLLQQASDSDFQ